MAPGSHLRLSPGTAGRRWVCPVRGYALSITAICSSCQIEIATIRFVNAAAEYLEEPFRRELRIQPVGGAIGITADVLVDGVAAQHAVQVQFVGKLLFRAPSGFRIALARQTTSSGCSGENEICI